MDHTTRAVGWQSVAAAGVGVRMAETSPAITVARMRARRGMGMVISNFSGEV
jgi:hypothetical protein